MIEARAGASVATATLHVAVVGSPTLVSFTLTDNTLSTFGAMDIEMVVELDQPAPVGGVVVDVSYNANHLVDVLVLPGSTVGSLGGYHLFGQLAAPGDYTLVAQLGGSVRTATLHITTF